MTRVGEGDMSFSPMERIGRKEFKQRRAVFEHWQSPAVQKTDARVSEQADALLHKTTRPQVPAVQIHKTVELDTAFIPTTSLYKTFYPLISKLASLGKGFDVAQFLTGLKSGQVANTALILHAVTELKTAAAAIGADAGIDKTHAYKQLIGMLDRYDEKALTTFKSLKIDPKSTFFIRSALLIAAQEDNAGIDSWMVYTKKGKPTQQSEGFWNFLDDWKHWVPEAQGKIAKYMEIAISKIRMLTHEYGENAIVLMKGGFGAGKTRMLHTLFSQQAGAVVAPDKAKQITRRALPEISHAKAHVEGSQVAYQLFDGAIQDVHGTVAYDSSLNDPKDIKKYIQKVKQSKRYNKELPPLAPGQPVLKIYDIARKDEARFLAVLRRDVAGEDPRIPPVVIKNSAIKDKMNRVDCMKAVQEEQGLNVEYNFISGDEKGWNTDFVAKISSCNRNIELKEENAKRLMLEGLVPESFAAEKLESSLTKEEVEKGYDLILQQPVQKLMQGLSTKENEENERVFGGRILIKSLEKPVTDIADIYSLLLPKVKEAITKEAFMASFEGISAENKGALLASVNQERTLSYLQLPFMAAAAIHSKLSADPWKR